MNTYASITTEQAFRIMRYISCHTTNIVKFYATVNIEDTFFSRNIRPDTYKEYPSLAKSFNAAVKVIGKKGIRLQITHDDDKRVFRFYAI